MPSGGVIPSIFWVKTLTVYYKKGPSGYRWSNDDGSAPDDSICACVLSETWDYMDIRSYERIERIISKIMPLEKVVRYKQVAAYVGAIQDFDMGQGDDQDLALISEIAKVEKVTLEEVQ